MIFTVLSEDQHSPEWRAARLGRLTSSCAADMLARIKSGEAAGRRNLRTRLVLERITGVSQESDFETVDMQRGREVEAEALGAYEALTGHVVLPVGCLGHPELMAGASPDGQINNFTGLVELKCPKAATHLGYLRARQVPDDYLKQVHHQLWITGAEWCDFVSYDPRFEPVLRLMVTRVTMSPADRASYELMVRAFLNEVDAEVAELQHLAAKYREQGYATDYAVV